MRTRIAGAAQEFGQQDDITVLSVESQREPSETAHTIVQSATA